MTKKNTLLYLNEELVEKAKKNDINISKLTEHAIRARLFPIVSEKNFLDIEKYLDDLREEGKFFWLPQKIDSVKLENIRSFEKFEVSFDHLTVIKGENGSGKSTVLRSIAQACGVLDKEEENVIKEDEEKGTIEVSVSTDEKYSFQLEDGRKRREGGCILLDDPMIRLSEERRWKFIEALREKFTENNIQVILTDSRFEESSLVDKVIEL